MMENMQTGRDIAIADGGIASLAYTGRTHEGSLIEILKQGAGLSLRYGRTHLISR